MDFSRLFLANAEYLRESSVEGREVAFPFHSGVLGGFLCFRNTYVLRLRQTYVNLKCNLHCDSKLVTGYCIRGVGGRKIHSLSLTRHAAMRCQARSGLWLSNETEHQILANGGKSFAKLQHRGGATHSAVSWDLFFLVKHTSVLIPLKFFQFIHTDTPPARIRTVDLWIFTHFKKEFKKKTLKKINGRCILFHFKINKHSLINCLHNLFN